LSVTGPARQSLTAQLQQRLAQERKEVEALTTAELKQLAATLSKASSDALDVMERDTNVRLSDMRRRLNDIEIQQRRWPLWTALSSAVIALAVFALLWMATSWARSDLKTALTERYEARQVLNDLLDQTRGATLQVSSTGREYVVGPEGSKAQICDGRPCIEMPEE